MSALLGKWGRACALPWLTLPAFTPGAIGHFHRAVPAFALGAWFHGAMRGALRGGVRGLRRCGEALENGVQPCQQAAFVRVAQGQLHLAPCDFGADVHRRWRLRQWRGGSVRLRWGWLRGWLSLAVGVSHLRLAQRLRSPGNRSAQAMLTEVMRRLLIVAAVTVPVDDVVGR